MVRKQKLILIKLFSVIAITLVAVFVIANVKNLIIRSESMRAMTSLSKVVSDYKKEHSCIPPQSYIDEIKSGLEGFARAGDIKYRGRWVNPENPKEEILAYSERNFHSFFVESGFVVLRLDGTVEWIKTKDFKALLKKQQSTLEIQEQENFLY